MMHRITVIAVLALAVFGCQEMDAPAAEKAAEPAAAQASATEDVQSEAGELARSDAPDQSEAPRKRKLIRNAELRVEVDSYREARAQLDDLLASIGGFVADAEIDHHDGAVSRARLTLRVPNEQLRVFLSEASGSGKVVHERLRSEDVTEAYFDVKARLKNKKRLEARLLELMKTDASSMKELLEVERELARVREEIERHEGRIRLWDEQVALSTVELELVSRQPYAAAPPATLTERVRATFDGSLEAMGTIGRAVVIAAVAAAPWLLPLALLGLALRALVRRRSGRAAQAGSVAAPS